MCLLAVSMGDPAGIGPEVILRASISEEVRREAALVVYGDPGVLERAAGELGVRARVVPVGDPRDAERRASPDELAVIAVSQITDPAFGWARPTAGSDRAQVEYIRSAYAAVASRNAEAMVTAPISKAALARAGVPWVGHTDMLGDLSGVERPIMMLVGPTLRVVPLTVHLPLKDVPSAIEREDLAYVISATERALRRDFGRAKPRIAIAGLNPHAGEGGLLGREEQDVIGPVIEEARARGIDASGPFPADTIFFRAASGAFDVVIGMYHDQALIPIKLLDFDRAVNVTLGLPIVRTSVDHGTAYDIAGKGVASASSMIAAMHVAVQMSRARATADAVSPGEGHAA